MRCAGLKKQPNLDVCWPGVLANQSLADQTEIISKVGPEAIGHHGSDGATAKYSTSNSVTL